MLYWSNDIKIYNTFSSQCTEKPPFRFFWDTRYRSGGSRWGRNRRATPLNFNRLWFLLSGFVWECFKIGSDIMREHLKPYSLQAPIRALNPYSKGLRILRSRCGWAHIIFCAPSKWKSWIRPCSKTTHHDRIRFRSILETLWYRGDGSSCYTGKLLQLRSLKNWKTIGVVSYVV